MRKFLLAILATLPFFIVTAVQADDDHRIAREVLKAGKIAPLETILERVALQFPGHILKTELEKDSDAEDGWAYEIKILREDGVVVEVVYDAKNLTILELEEGGKKKVDTK
ncbi:MAG: PepSY domain-containing protein [Alphaproteobacteria bacterium]|nr:PepSY domain-containing protein [Rhodospirillales bacterium]MCW9046184.1 PepSY domain-containing protein [Alphaproteobacteria bacterium]